MPLSDKEIKKIDAIEDALANKKPVVNLAENTKKRIRKNNAENSAFEEGFPLQGVPLPLDFFDSGKGPSSNQKQKLPKSKLMGDSCVPHEVEEPTKRPTHNAKQEKHRTALMGEVYTPRRQGWWKYILKILSKK